MIKAQNTRNGGWSASAIFHEAKRHHNLRQALRRSPRGWWKTQMQKWGDVYDAAWAPRDMAFDNYEVSAGWIVATKSWDYWQPVFFGKIKEHGGERVSVWLAWPHHIYHKLVEDFGAQCDFCEGPVYTQIWRKRLLCRACERRAERIGGIEKLLATAILKKARRQAHALSCKSSQAQ